MRRHIECVTLVVDDYDRAIAFYVDALGFELREDTPGEPVPGNPRKRWVVVAPRGAETGILLAQAADDAQRARIGAQTGGRVGFFLHTDDFARDHAALRARGVRFLEAPREEPYGTVAVFEDLYGNRWDLLQPRARATPLAIARLVLASGNRGKLLELRELLADAAIPVHAQSEFGIGDAEETGASFVENAILKARHAARATGLPALGDDSGLCVDALDGAPGLYSARYSGVHGDAAANIAKLLDALRTTPPDARSARFVCALALVRHAEDPMPILAEGVWEGRILGTPRGGGGFGYDPVFFDPSHDCSAAELDPALKNRISHRGRALASLRDRLFAQAR